MIQPADIREWRDHNVVDSKGHKIGALEAVYVDTATDEPAMATVKTGLPTRQRLVFVPVDDAVVGPDYLKVPYEKGTVRKAPSISMDGVLPVEYEQTIFQYYGMARPGGGGRHLARR
ncbi:PRC-barrel domain-containing protein [Streptomyces sp. GC420]|uniref:PRC-barrel domain-containing protein n=1 Tax=Streptomyces sp. GC420 TaxID=2697568 RepID=UPI001414FD4D|nr:PRC-barrel domain-containing protein [Streptomyces sp. GC420]NBM17656.1 PRC-barrel domain containing protein [Streptomyces sp. GC420]